MSEIECGSALTVVEVGHCSQDVAVGVQGLWLADSTRGVFVRIQDDLGVDEIPGGDPIVQGLAKSGSGRHASERSTNKVIVGPGGICINCLNNAHGKVHE